jgi:hypothetical protein
LDEGVDMHYYFKKDTGESKWDEPEEGFVQCEWSIQEDPTSGAMYYFNIWSVESQWSTNKNDKTAELEQEVYSVPRVSFRRVTTEDGTSYYHNEESGETVWTVPEGADVVE